MADFTRNLAVIIGINDYANGIPRLTTALNDARTLATILRRDYGYEILLLDANVTRARLAHLLDEELPALLGQDGRLLVYFAGHGIALDGEDGPEGFLIPQDAHPQQRATFWPMAEIHAGLNRLQCRHLLAIFDCCFAGAFRWSSTRQLQLVLPPILHQERYDRFVRDAAWQVLTSAAFDQQALDILAGDVVGQRGAISADDGQHSPFALALFAGLSGAADLIPRSAGDGVITATELYLYLRDAVEQSAERQAGHRQTPGLWPLPRHDKGEFIFLSPGHRLNLPPAPNLTAENNPYRGLQPYREADAELLFGRSELIDQLVARVQTQPLTAVLGASGTGKSSVVRAGLIPTLRTDPAHEWLILPIIRPGDAPNRILADTLSAALGLDPTLHGEITPLIAKLDEWLAAHPPVRILLTIDQFEELITLCRDEAGRAEFLATIANLVAHESGRIHLVLTLRTDFEPQFGTTAIAAALQANRFVVTPLSASELRAVIEEPAARRVLFFDPPELVDRLVEAVLQTPGALPLLSFTLSELYLKYLQRQNLAQQQGEVVERSLTLADYQALGGAIGSLSTRADEVYAALDPAQQATMQRVMLRMVAIEGGELARRRVLNNELHFAESAENERVTTVIERLVEARLLVRGSADLDGDTRLDPYIEPAHDALVRSWSQLQRWKSQADAYLPLQRRLTRAAQEWHRAPEAERTGLLWDDDPGLPQILPDILHQSSLTGSLLNPLQTLWPSAQMAKAPVWLNQSESEFIATSLQRRANVRRRLVSITLTVMIVLAVTTIAALIQRNLAQRQAEVSQSTALAAGARQAIQNNDYDLALPLAVQANQIDDPPEFAVNALAAAAFVPGTRHAQTWHTGDVSGVAFSADGQLVLTASFDGNAELWATASGEIRHQLPSEVATVPITGVAYDPTDARAFLGREDGSILQWDTETGAAEIIVAQMAAAVTALAISPDGQTLLAGDDAGALGLWRLAEQTQQPGWQAHEDGISALAISDDGHQALSGSLDNRMILWDLATGEAVQRFERHQGDVVLVAFGPFPGNVLSGSRDSNVVIWDIASGDPRNGFALSEHTQGIGSIALAPDGSTVVSGGWDGSINLWDRPPLGGFIHSFVGHRSPVVSLTYSPDGRFVLSGAKDGSVRLWDIGGPALLRRFTVELPLVNRRRIHPLHNLAVDETHQHALSGGARQLILWDLADGTVIHNFPAPADQLSAVAISPDGARALSGASTAITEWDLERGESLRELAGHGAELLILQYSADGQSAFSAAANRTIKTWDLVSGEPINEQRLDYDSSLWSVAFGVDGATALTGWEDRSVILWDLASGEEIRRFVGHQDAVYWVTISADGQRGLSGSADRQIMLWDLASGELIRTFQGHRLPVHTVAFSPDGRTILSGGEDQTIRLWDAESGAEIFRFEGHSTTIQNVVYLRQAMRLLSRGSDGSLILWQFPPAEQDLAHLNLVALQDWAMQNRYIRALTCDEQLLYNIRTSCLAD